MDKAILTCAVNGVLTNPKQHPVPVTPEEMAASAKEACHAGARSSRGITLHQLRPGTVTLLELSKGKRLCRHR